MSQGTKHTYVRLAIISHCKILALFSKKKLFGKLMKHFEGTKKKSSSVNVFFIVHVEVLTLIHLL